MDSHDAWTLTEELYEETSPQSTEGKSLMSFLIIWNSRFSVYIISQTITATREERLSDNLLAVNFAITQILLFLK